MQHEHTTPEEKSARPLADMSKNKKKHVSTRLGPFLISFPFSHTCVSRCCFFVGLKGAKDSKWHILHYSSTSDRISVRSSM
uniref:Uncharacterized protein n=1 Tax=Penaeus monodon TaxID=6687 RepID=Q8MWC2_PENMO|nr:unknown [Penaeus monodon]